LEEVARLAHNGVLHSEEELGEREFGFGEFA
jgi:hypothetical protein